MKNLVLGLATLLSVSAQAAPEIAKYRFAIAIEGDQPYEFNTSVVDVSIRDNGKLKVKGMTYEGQAFFPRPEEVVEITDKFRKTLTLPKFVFKVVRDQIIGLSTAEIKESYKPNVCMQMPTAEMAMNHLSVVRDYNFGNQKFEGELKLIDDASGCWNTNHINPTSEAEDRAAYIVKELIKKKVAETL